MDTLFESAFLKSVRKHTGIKKQIEKKVRLIIQHPVEFGEPLKGNLRGYYSCPVKRNFIIIYLYCKACRKRGNDTYVNCSDCSTMADETIKFILLGPHNEAYNNAK